MLKASEMEARGSKTLVAAEPMRRPSWLVWTLMKSFRTLLLTVLWSGLGMGAGLFCGILGVLVASAMLHRNLEMELAYRYVAIPVAIGVGSCTLLWNLIHIAQAAAERRRS